MRWGSSFAWSKLLVLYLFFPSSIVRLFMFTCGLWAIIFLTQRVPPTSSFFSVLCSNLILFSLTCLPPRSPLTFSLSCKQCTNYSGVLLCSLFIFHCPTIVLCPFVLSLCFPPSPSSSLLFPPLGKRKKNEREKDKWGDTGGGLTGWVLLKGN